MRERVLEELAKTKAVKSVREPDAGDLHVRFDERDVEMEYKARPDERSGNRPVLHNGTAPHLNFTPLSCSNFLQHSASSEQS